MSLVALVRVTDGAQVFVESNLTSALEPLPGDPTATRISVVRGADAIETSYVDVQGTPAAIAAALAAGGLAPFGSSFQINGGNLSTDGNVFLPVCGVTIPPGGGGPTWIQACALLACSNTLGNGSLLVQLFKNGAPFGEVQEVRFDQWSAAEVYAFAFSVFQADGGTLAGDLYELRLATSGAPGDFARVAGGRIATWRIG